MYMDMQRIFVIILTKEQSAHKSFALRYFETKQILTWFWIVIHSYRFLKLWFQMKRIRGCILLKVFCDESIKFEFE